MKKKILFVIPSLRGGGAEKSLITLLTLFNRDRYEIDLLCFRRDGMFINSIPDDINVIGGTEDYENFDGSTVNAVKYFLKKGKIKNICERIKYIGVLKNSDLYLREKNMWKLLKRQLPVLNKKYDCVIGYLEGPASFYAVEYENTDKRIVYVHNDIAKLGLNKKNSSEVFRVSDYVVTVSEECKRSLDDNYPEFKDKFKIIENITSPDFIKIQASEASDFDCNRDCEAVLLTVGRLAPQKGIDLAVKSCYELKNRGRKIKWYHLGTGSLYGEITELINSLGVQEEFILLGEKPNPYPYMLGCDIYVQPSRYEGKSIAIDEVKSLCRPMVVTNFTTVADQITDGINGLICTMDAKDMADKIEKLILDPSLRSELSDNLRSEAKGNESEINKLYALID